MGDSWVTWNLSCERGCGPIASPIRNHPSSLESGMEGVNRCCRAGAGALGPCFELPPTKTPDRHMGSSRCVDHSRDETRFDVGRIEKDLSLAVDPLAAPRQRPSAPMMTRI